MAETAEGARLLSGYTDKTVSRVRIPPSPPLELNPLETVGFFFLDELYSCGYISGIHLRLIMPSAGISSLLRYRSYLTTHRGILYFRILVPNHLQSLIGKREIIRSLNSLHYFKGGLQ